MIEWLGALYLQNGASQLSDKSSFIQLTKDITINDRVTYHSIIANNDADITKGLAQQSCKAIFFTLNFKAQRLVQRYMTLSAVFNDYQVCDQSVAQLACASREAHNILTAPDSNVLIYRDINYLIQLNSR